MEYYRGYIPTKDKKAMCKYGSRDLFTYEDIQSCKEYAGVLKKGIILIDVDNEHQSEILEKIINDLHLKCRMIQTTRGKHFLFKDTNAVYKKCHTHIQTPIGITIDVKTGISNSYEILKMECVQRRVLREEDDPDEVPFFLSYIDYDNTKFIDMVQGARNQSLFNYLIVLYNNGFNINQCRTITRIINKYVFKESLPTIEIDTILRDDSFKNIENRKYSSIDNNNICKQSEAEEKQTDIVAIGKYLYSLYHFVEIENGLYYYIDGYYKFIYKDHLRRLCCRYKNDLTQIQKTKICDYIIDNLDTIETPRNYNLICFKNGIYDIITDQLRPFDPGTIITNKINHNFIRNAYNADIDYALNLYSCYDDEIRNLLEEIVGYCIYRGNNLKKSFLLTGEGDNGKSTFLHILKSLLGKENLSNLDLGELHLRFKSSELFGKLANIGDDIDDSFIENISIFKKLVSGDPINAERKGENPFDYSNNAKLIFSANTMPRVKDDTGSVLRRIIIIPFNAKFEEGTKNCDIDIKDKLSSETCLEYLIWLGINALKRLMKNKHFTYSNAVSLQLQEYDNINNPIKIFFKSLSKDDLNEKTTQEVYNAYVSWCIESGIKAISKMGFSKMLKRVFKNIDTEIKRIDGKPTRIYVIN